MVTRARLHGHSVRTSIFPAEPYFGRSRDKWMPVDDSHLKNPAYMANGSVRYPTEMLYANNNGNRWTCDYEARNTLNEILAKKLQILVQAIKEDLEYEKALDEAEEGRLAQQAQLVEVSDDEFDEATTEDYQTPDEIPAEKPRFNAPAEETTNEGFQTPDMISTEKTQLNETFNKPDSEGQQTSDVSPAEQIQSYDVSNVAVDEDNQIPDVLSTEQAQLDRSDTDCDVDNIVYGWNGYKKIACTKNIPIYEALADASQPLVLSIRVQDLIRHMIRLDMMLAEWKEQGVSESNADFLTVRMILIGRWSETRILLAEQLPRKEDEERAANVMRYSIRLRFPPHGNR